MAFLQITAVNANSVFANLRNVVMKDYSKLWPYAAEPLKRNTRAAWASEGTLGAHGGWADLSPNYAARKRRKWGEKGILVARGDLYDAFQDDSAFTFNPQFMTYGAADPKLAEIAYYHQMGYDTVLGKSITRHSGFFGKLAPRHKAPPRVRRDWDALAHVPARRIFDFNADFPGVLARALAGGYVVICRRRGYAMWQAENDLSGGMEKMGPGAARLMGQQYYSGLMNPGAPM